MGHISFVGKLDGVALSAGAPPIAPGLTLDLMAKHSLDFWLTSEDLPDPNNRVTLDRDGNIVLSLHAEQRGGPQAADAKLEEPAQAAATCDHGTTAIGPARATCSRPAHPARRRRAPERHDPLRPRPEDLGARRELQGARRRQPLRRRRQLLPVERRGEPGADDHGQRAARRRPPARAARRERDVAEVRMSALAIVAALAVCARRARGGGAPRRRTPLAVTAVDARRHDGLGHGPLGRASTPACSTFEKVVRRRGRRARTYEQLTGVFGARMRVVAAAARRRSDRADRVPGAARPADPGRLRAATTAGSSTSRSS